MRAPAFYDWPKVLDEFYIPTLKTRIRLSYYYIGGFGSYRIEILVKHEKDAGIGTYRTKEWQAWPDDNNQKEYMHQDKAEEAIKAAFVMHEL